MTSTSLTIDDSDNILKELETAFFDIPFENSAFQTESFVIAAQITPERAYRAIGLRMSAKLRALNEAKYGRMREDIDIDELREKIVSVDTTKWDKARAEIDIMQKLENRTYADKLINDALAELSILYKHFKQLPKFSREQFEAGERRHFEQSLQRQVLGLAGAKESLTNMGEDFAALAAFEINYAQLLEDTSDITSEKLLSCQVDVNLIKSA
jgi:hypothetical protein